MAANATFALKPGVWFLRVRFVIFAPDSRREPSPPSGRKSTQPTVQILEASSAVDPPHAHYPTPMRRAVHGHDVENRRGPMRADDPNGRIQPHIPPTLQRDVDGGQVQRRVKVQIAQTDNWARCGGSRSAGSTRLN